MVKKAIKLLSGIFLVYGLLVATHLGEFWPFSIYPMFSQGGHPWTRAMVTDVTEDGFDLDWETKTGDAPGTVFALNDVSINQNDLANFISKNDDWSEGQVANLRKYFRNKLPNHDLLVHKVQGHLVEGSDSTVISYMPAIYLAKDTTIFNPDFVDTANITEE